MQKFSKSGDLGLDEIKRTLLTLKESVSLDGHKRIMRFEMDIGSVEMLVQGPGTFVLVSCKMTSHN